MIIIISAYIDEFNKRAHELEKTHQTCEFFQTHSLKNKKKIITSIFFA